MGKKINFCNIYLIKTKKLALINSTSMRSSLLCMKYKGLKFYNIFQSGDFIFLPTTLLEDPENGVPIDIESHSCKYDKNAEFYVLLKGRDDEDGQLKQQLAKFKFLEGILMFLFSNKIFRRVLFTLDNEKEYRIKKVIRFNPSEPENEQSPLLWKNIILIDFFQQVLNNSFKIFNDLEGKQEDFAEEFYFSIGMYLKGKYSGELLNIITSLWISLEVFSTISIIFIFKTDNNLIKSGLGDFKKCIKKIAPYYINKEESECWEPLKEEFFEHIVNKITNHLPIKHKINMLVKKTLEDDKTGLPKSLTNKKLINYFYDNRNNVVHNGRLPKITDIGLYRKQAFFSMMIERLIVKILRFQNVDFFTFGDHEYLFMKFKGEINEYYGNYSGSITTYIISKFHLLSFKDWESEGSNIDTKLKSQFYTINKEYGSLILKLNQVSDELLNLCSNVIRMELRSEEKSEIFSIQFKEISSKGFKIRMLDEEKNFFSSYAKALIEEIEVKFKSIDNPYFIITFSGFIEKIIKKNLLYLKMIPNQIEITINT